MSDNMMTTAVRPSLLASLRPGPVLMRLATLLAALLILFGLLLGDRFFSVAAVRSMAFQLPELGVLSLAMMIPLLSGGLDLSIIATANLSALATAYVFTHLGVGDIGITAILWHLLAIVVGLGVAGAIGTLNGVVIAYLGVSPILATLGSMTMVKGIAVGLTHGGIISGFPPFMVFIGNGSVFGVPMVLIVFVLIAIPVGILLTRTPFGNIVAMLGSNERAVRYSGIDTRRVLIKVYILSGLLSAVAGMLMMARFNSANAAYGESYLLITILAAVLGGIDPAGGFGKVSGLVLSLVILQLVSTATNLLNISQFLSLALWGAILLGVAGVGRVWAFVLPYLPARLSR
jgi:simple sugar transport system permease protein